MLRLHLGLAQPRLDERAAHPGLTRRLETGAVVTEVVRVRAVDDHREAERLALAGRRPVELGLAEKAAILRVCRVVWVAQLVGGDDDVPRAERLRDPLGVEAFAFGQRGAHGGEADGPLAEHVRRHLQDEGAVETAAVRDEDRAHLGDDLSELRELVGHGPRF